LQSGALCLFEPVFEAAAEKEDGRAVSVLSLVPN
jgi:hypothetical protein